MRFPLPFRLAALLGVVASPAMAIEQPRYDVIGRDGDVEIRRYASYLVAETFVADEFDSAGNEGFRRLFRYITGANAARAEISMTAPVSQQAGGTRIDMTAPVAQTAEQGGHWVAFMVPSSFTPETVPQPTDQRVRIRQVPAQTMAVFRYAGFWSETRYQREEQRLREGIAANGLTPAGEAQFARYDPPYVPPFMRRNEILIPLADTVRSRENAPAARGLTPLAAN